MSDANRKRSPAEAAEPQPSSSSSSEDEAAPPTKIIKKRRTGYVESRAVATGDYATGSDEEEEEEGDDDDSSEGDSTTDTEEEEEEEEEDVGEAEPLEGESDGGAEAELELEPGEDNEEKEARALDLVDHVEVEEVVETGPDGAERITLKETVVYVDAVRESRPDGTLGELVLADMALTSLGLADVRAEAELAHQHKAAARAGKTLKQLKRALKDDPGNAHVQAALKEAQRELGARELALLADDATYTARGGTRVQVPGKYDGPAKHQQPARYVVQDPGQRSVEYCVQCGVRTPCPEDECTWCHRRLDRDDAANMAQLCGVNHAIEGNDDIDDDTEFPHELCVPGRRAGPHTTETRVMRGRLARAPTFVEEFAADIAAVHAGDEKSRNAKRKKAEEKKAAKAAAGVATSSVDSPELEDILVEEEAAQEEAVEGEEEEHEEEEEQQ